MSVTESG